MAHVNAAQVPRDLQDLLFKADRPRTIDRYIDYFGMARTAGDEGSGSAAEGVERPR